MNEKYLFRFGIRYNLTLGLIGNNPNDSRWITKKEKILIYKEVLPATNLAKGIVLNHLQEKNEVKKLVLTT